jgi:hypothetical protein
MAEEKVTDFEEKLRLAREGRAKREDEARQRAEAVELEALELEEKYTAELGPRGVKFDMVTNDVGVFVVKLGEFVAHKRFNSKGDEVSEEDVFALVTPSLIYPPAITALPLLRTHAGIAWDLALAMQRMYRARKETRAGKSLP